MKDGSDSRNKVLRDLSVRGRKRLERPLEKPRHPAQRIGRGYLSTTTAASTCPLRNNLQVLVTDPNCKRRTYM
jgi:hypothetical protein